MLVKKEKGNQVNKVDSGRLDKDTSGLLLFTNDHDLNHNIRKADNSVTKEYYLTIEIVSKFFIYLTLILMK